MQNKPFFRPKDNASRINARFLSAEIMPTIHLLTSTLSAAQARTKELIQ